ncbi:MAG: sulfatase-like hydrolase/transferase [Candidatus Latescibacterota bacterium]|nr:sulfatase-like hydrolase/transferase [Candidatus Latescibacterota bacterium]
MSQPNVLFVMTDQQRADTIASLGNHSIYTPNLDRLVARGVSFVNAYSQTPVCVAARYAVRTGRDPLLTRVFSNGQVPPAVDQAEQMTDRCGSYLGQTMQGLGYRSFGIGKFHSQPWDEDLGYDVHLRSEEILADPQRRAGDAYGAHIAEHAPAYDFIEGLHGERTEMYYMPQMSPMPAEHTVEGWAADRAVEQIERTDDERPFFGFVSFIGPHPPLAPPIPFNRLYNPDLMASPVSGDPAVDHADEQIPHMNYGVWAEDVSDSQARVLKTRYYGEITYIDDCLGRILDAVEARPDADNTVICFFADHGDHLGDHQAWQKESFFEASCHIPFLVSWPERLPRNERREDLVALIDLFGIATGAAGQTQVRDGVDVLSMLTSGGDRRERLVGLYGAPGTRRFKAMVREDRWKYIWLANGARQQLFDVTADPQELRDLSGSHSEIVARLHRAAIDHLRQPGGQEALDGDDLHSLPFEARPLQRIYQFGHWPRSSGFPEDPGEALRTYQAATGS